MATCSLPTSTHRGGMGTLATMLADRRHSSTRIEKILGKNLMRVFAESWKT
jgi:microsomal dipeptidase-like Zn-dependent dipeptidase